MKCNIDYREDNRWTVYVHIVPKSLSGYDWDKYYVGITGMSPQRRWRKNGKGYYKQKYFYNAIKKYGWDNIEHEIIAEHLTESEANDLEILLIKQLKSNDFIHGYNISSGGIDSINNKAVIQYSKEGYFIEIYSSIHLAEQITKINCNSIISACKGKIRIAGGYQWRYFSENFKEKIEPYDDDYSRYKVLQYDIYGNLIKIWKSAKEAAKTLNINRDNIKSACCGQTLTYKGYQWKWENSTTKVEDVSKETRLRHNKFYQYDIEGNFIGSFDNIVQKSIELKNPKLKDRIYRKIKEDITNNFYYGYRWTNEYYEKLPPLSEKGLKQVKEYERKN